MNVAHGACELDLVSILAVSRLRVRLGLTIISVASPSTSKTGDGGLRFSCGNACSRSGDVSIGSMDGLLPD